MIYLVLFVGLILRLISLNQSLWLDEATSVLAAKMSITDLFIKFLPADFHPPLYYLLLKFWVSIFGSSEIALRIPSIIFGLGIVWTTYLISKKLFDKKVGLISALLASTSGLLIYYSQEARMYMMAAFLVSLAIYLFTKKKWFWFSLVLPLIAMTDYVSMLILPVFWLMGRKDRKNLILSHIPLTIIFAFWSPVFLTQLGHGLSQEGTLWWRLLGLPTLKNILLIPVKFIFGRISFDDKVLYALIAGIVFGIFGYFLYLAKKGPQGNLGMASHTCNFGNYFEFKNSHTFLFPLPFLFTRLIYFSCKCH